MRVRLRLRLRLSKIWGRDREIGRVTVTLRLWSSVAQPGTSESQTTAEGGTRLMATPKALQG